MWVCPRKSLERTISSKTVKIHKKLYLHAGILQKNKVFSEAFAANIGLASLILTSHEVHNEAEGSPEAPERTPEVLSEPVLAKKDSHWRLILDKNPVKVFVI